ncbi:hypothetical protein [Flavobacterium sp. 3HN19-14]|uniref:hypothetical protein n=1 Tax=Flavobacterium sp. 3HN19-14 TaxID=3448133 RepID=UPI003EE0B868
MLYKIFVENNLIGTTQFEKSDAPMGVVIGKINFIEVDSGYKFFKNYCVENNISFTDSDEEKLILTMNIPNLKVISERGIEIIGQSKSISGMDSDIFEINIEGISYPFYEEEFPEQLKVYHEMFVEKATAQPGLGKIAAFRAKLKQLFS